MTLNRTSSDLTPLPINFAKAARNASRASESKLLTVASRVSAKTRAGLNEPPGVRGGGGDGGGDRGDGGGSSGRGGNDGDGGSCSGNKDT